MEAVADQSVFLTQAERAAILASREPIMLRFRHALRLRVTERLAIPGLQAESPMLGRATLGRATLGRATLGRATLGWWYPCAEYLSDAALHYALEPTEALATWLRSTTLHIARRPTSDWVGPWFRSHAEPFVGHLETAHVCWGVSAVLSLATDVFTTTERNEVREALAKKGVVLCRRWLTQNTHLANWRGILASGAVVASAALGDEETLAELMPDLMRMAQAFQPDGSYGESLQYGNYLANALMLAHEALIRAYPHHARHLDLSAYGKGMGWMAQSMLYQKPMTGWGIHPGGDAPRARAVNFNDSAALFRPSGDLLLHVAARYPDATQARLARWLFAEYYATCPTQGPHDLATFGMLNDWGFLTLPLLTQPRQPLSPEAANLPLTVGFSNGNTFVRDSWTGQSVLAIQGGNNDGVYAPGHLQGDLNSFMLAYNRERLLVDPGHSCYRNLIHGLESATQTHNTCTFLRSGAPVENDTLGLQEDLAKTKLLEQRNVLARRLIKPDGSVGNPVERGGRLLAVQREGGVSLVVSEVGTSYGAPIREFTRCWVQAGPHLTLVFDRIRADEPVRTVWNWLLNNRDGQSVTHTAANTLTLYRHQTGLRMWHLGAATLNGPVYGYLHDAYHPEPAQPGEGRPGSGLLFRFTDGQNAQTITRLHVIVADEAALVDGWQLWQTGSQIGLTREETSLSIDGEYSSQLNLSLYFNGVAYRINEGETGFSLKRRL